MRSDIEHIWQVAWRLSFYRGGAVFMSAISGIDIALWDLKGGLFTYLLPPLTNAPFSQTLALHPSSSSSLLPYPGGYLKEEEKSLD
jgi:response regulator of citrate/malate metabolism